VRYISKESFNPEFGARPVKRYIQKNISDAISQMLISGGVEIGDIVKADVAKNKVVFKIKQKVKV
jgi:ATP-dependent Clp protease ATP-binding subunit ClpB